MDDGLLDKALALKPDEKLYLIALLNASLDGPDDRVGKAWLDEAKIRLEEVEKGRARLLPVSEVLDRFA